MFIEEKPEDVEEKANEIEERGRILFVNMEEEVLRQRLEELKKQVEKQNLKM